MALVASASLASCGDEADRPANQPQEITTRATTTSGPSTDRPLRAPPCPPDLANCRRASGRIAYVERVDPDGDGDAHFVLLSSDSITGPGLTVVDVRRDLRPRPLPGIGDQLAAAGPVRTGSYGQRQIEAVEVRLAR